MLPPFAAAPASFKVPTIGDVEIAHSSTRFLNWFSELAITEGAEVFRAMLRDHGRGAGQRTPLDPDVIARLDPDALRQGASAFLAAAGPQLRPRWIRDPSSSSPGGVRERTLNEVEDVAAKPDEDEFQCLLRILALSAEDINLGRRHQIAKSAAQTSKVARTGLTPGILAQTRIIKELTSTGHLNSMIENLPSNRLKGLISEASGASALIQRHELLTSIRTDMIPAYLQRGALDALQQRESILRTAGLLGAHPKGTPGLAGGGVYNQLLSGTLRNLSASRALASVPRPGDWLKDINSALGLGLTAQIIAAAATIQASPLPHPAELSPYMRPGWQATAAVGVARDDARPAARAALATYDDAEAVENEMLAATIAIAHRIDAIEGTEDSLPEELVTAAEIAWGKFLALRETVGEELRKAGLVASVACVLSLAGVVGTGIAIPIAMSGPTAAQHEALMRQSDAVLREEEQTTRDALLDDARSLRRVTKPCLARTAPDRDAPEIVTIYPDELVRVTGERGDWVKVEIYQYGSDALVTGWTPRKYIAHRG